MEIAKTFGKNVRKYRKLRDLSQEELAFRINVNMSNINRIENGTQFVTAETFQNILDVLNIEAAQLFEYDKEERKPKKKYSFKERLYNYLSAQTEEDAKFFFDYIKLYMKHKIQTAKNI